MWRALKPLHRRLHRLHFQLRLMCQTQITNEFKLTDNLSAIPNIAEDLQRKRTVLYPDVPDKNVQSLSESSSMQEIFDIYDSVPDSEKTEKLSSQALVALKDLQNALFRYNHLLPQQSILDPAVTKSTLRDHPIFKNIVQHVVSNCSQLGDETVADCLLYLKRLQADIRRPECQTLIEELRSRKQSLNVKALSNFYMVLVDPNNLYGYSVQAEFLPLLNHYLDSMTKMDNADIRAISITLKYSNYIIPESMVFKYRENLEKMYESGEIIFEPAALTKILSFLFDSQGHYSPDHPEWNNSSRLIRNYGKLLTPLVGQMDHIDFLSISKFINQNREPTPLLDALSLRISQQFHDTPNIFWVSLLQPKNYEEQQQVSKFLHELVDTCPYFEHIAHIISRSLRKVPWDLALYNKFWTKLSQVIKKKSNHQSSISSNGDEFSGEDNNDFSYNYYGYSEGKQLQGYRFVVDYLSCLIYSNRSYRHRQFESTAYREISQYLEDYKNNKLFLTTVQYAKCFSFINAVNEAETEINYNFFNNFRTANMLDIFNFMDVRRNNNFQVYAALNRRAEYFFNENSSTLSPIQCLDLARLNTKYQRTFECSPFFSRCINQVILSEWDDSDTASRILGLMLSVGYYDAQAMDKVSKLICDIGEDLSLDFVLKFLYTTYVCGTEYLPALDVCSRIVEKSWERSHPIKLLPSILSMNYHRCLSNSLTKEIFSFRYIESVDKILASMLSGSIGPVWKVRKFLMELNRAVCIDQPDANVPWFHTKYCEEIKTIDNKLETYLHKEVGQLLGEILGSRDYIFQNAYSPYFYKIDFLLQFDNQGHPIKGGIKSNLGEEDVATKVAILVHNPKDYTTNVRTLKGNHKLKRRHLEILGYHVVNIDPVHWDSMPMSEKLAKIEYLENSIHKNNVKKVQCAVDG